MSGINLVSGNKAFYAPGANLVTNGIALGDMILVEGHALMIASVTDEEHGTLTEPCPREASGSNRRYSIKPTVTV